MCFIGLNIIKIRFDYFIIFGIFEFLIVFFVLDDFYLRIGYFLNK